MTRALRAGGLTNPDAWRGRVTFDEWLGGVTGSPSDSRRCAPALLRLAYGQLGSLADAEDVVQEAWLRCGGRPRRGPEPGGLVDRRSSRLALGRCARPASPRGATWDRGCPSRSIESAGPAGAPARRVPSASRCSSCSRALRPPSAPRSSCTTCSATPSRGGRGGRPNAGGRAPAGLARPPRRRGAAPALPATPEQQRRSSMPSSRARWGDMDALVALLPGRRLHLRRRRLVTPRASRWSGPSASPRRARCQGRSRGGDRGRQRRAGLLASPAARTVVASPSTTAASSPSTSCATPRSCGCDDGRCGGRWPPRVLGRVPGCRRRSAALLLRRLPVRPRWVELLPPYNEHLIRDVGGFYLAFALLFAWAALRPSRQLVIPLAAAWSVAALLRAVYTRCTWRISPPPTPSRRPSAWSRS